MKPDQHPIAPMNKIGVGANVYEERHGYRFIFHLRSVDPRMKTDLDWTTASGYVILGLVNLLTSCTGQSPEDALDAALNHYHIILTTNQENP